MKTVFTYLLLMSALAAKPFPNSHMIRVDGISMHYRIDEVSDTSDWIVMIHGFGGSTESWRKLVPQLTNNGFNCVTIDLPGFGYSQRAKVLPHGQSCRAILLWKMLKTAFPNVKQWHLMGHSMGGGTVLAMALIEPMMTKSLTIVDGALFSSLDTNTIDQKPMLGWLPKGIVGYVADNLLIRKAFIRSMLRSAYASEPSNSDIEAYLIPLQQKGTSAGILRMSNNMSECFSLQARDLQCPVQIVWGDKDTWVPYNTQQSIVTSWPKCVIHIINGAGHCPMETHPDQFIIDILPLLLQPSVDATH